MSSLRLAVLTAFAASFLQAQLITSFVPGPIRNNFGNYVGLEFTTDANVHRVTALGRIVLPGNTGKHTVKLVHASDGTDVPGAVVTVSTTSGTPGNFVYTNLSTPIYLQPNTSYYLVSLETNGGDTWYDYTPVTASQFVINGPVYFNGNVWVPVGLPNESYVPPNMIIGGGGLVTGSVTITSPTAGAAFSDTNITLSANAAVSSDFLITGVSSTLTTLPSMGQLHRVRRTPSLSIRTYSLAERTP